MYPDPATVQPDPIVLLPSEVARERPARQPPTRPAVADLPLPALTAALEQLGVPVYRARQLFRGVHHRHAQDWGELTDLPSALRTQLADQFRLSALELRTEQRSTDGTVKLLLAAWDGQAIETVQIPAARGERRQARGDRGHALTPPLSQGERELGLLPPGGGRLGRGGDPSRLTSHASRLTVCVSSQAGCALACGFCATGQMGFARNLTVGEIVEQIYRAEQPGTERRVDNVVFMGMGEPMANYENVVGAIRVLAEPLGYGFSPRRVTVSTSGLVPEMRRLADEGLEVRLAVSLHAPDDALRSQLMPINRRYPIAEVLAAADAYAERSSRRVSYEYVMLDGLNDGQDQARRLASRLHGHKAHVNLIPYNQTYSGYRSSPPARIRAFADTLRTQGIACTIRASRGQDIAAACGQLKAENQRHRR